MREAEFYPPEARMSNGTAQEATVTIGGATYQISSDDEYLEHVRGVFEPHTVKLLQTLATGTRTVLDVGANIGCTALLLSQLSQSVHAFEPSPTTFAFLRQNLLANGVGNVTAHNLGLGLEDGGAELTYSPSNRSGGFVSGRTRASGDHVRERISLRRLDTAVRELGLRSVDFIKIDVEGFEGQVLKGGADTLFRHRPLVVLELNHWCLNAFQRTSVPEFFDLLRAIFPVVLAVEGSIYRDLRSEGECYAVMYQHILHMKFQNVVAGFHKGQLADFVSRYQHRPLL